MKDWPFGIIIPNGFSQKILEGEPVKLHYVKGTANPERNLEAQSRLTHAIVRFTQGLITSDISQGTLTCESIESLRAALDKPQILSVSRMSHTSLRPPPSGFNMSIPGFMIMFVMQMTVIYGGVTLVVDRLYGQYTRLASAPLHPTEIFIGRTLSRVIQASLQAFLILLAGNLLFGISFGEHPLFLIPVIVSFAAFAGCFSILCGMVCTTEQQVVNAAILTAILLSALGGCWWPIEIIPDTFKTIAYFTPTFWGLHGFQNILYFGKSYEVLWIEIPILLAYAALFILIALPFAKRYRY